MTMLAPLCLLLATLATQDQPTPPAKPAVISRLRADLPVLRVDQLPPLGTLSARPEANLRPDTRWFDRLQRTAKEGRLPAYLVEDGATSLSGKTDPGPGWKGYLFVVPPEQTLTVTLDHPDAEWFRLEPLDEFGGPKATAFLTAGPGEKPRVILRNRMWEYTVVVVAVQDPGRRATATPYRLTLERTWNPGQNVPKRAKDSRIWAPVPLVQGE